MKAMSMNERCKLLSIPRRCFFDRERARGVAIEQSIEAPLAVIRDPRILSDIVGQVTSIEDQGGGWFGVRIDLASATVGEDAGQLLNMLFGNASLYDDVVLDDAVFPRVSWRLSAARAMAPLVCSRAQSGRRALTCSALKPQGLTVEELAALAYSLALGGLDYIKDDHGSRTSL